MCLINVKDEEERNEAVRVRVQRVARSPSPRPIRVARRSVIEERRPASSLPSIRPSAFEESTTVVRSERAVSREAFRPPSRAPSARSRVRSAYVEVDHESESSAGESEALSKTTRKSSRSRATAPTDYSMHEREIRRERGYSRPRNEYETYRYVEPPRRSLSRASAPKSNYYEYPRASRDSIGKRVTIEDDYRRTTREYR